MLKHTVIAKVAGERIQVDAIRTNVAHFAGCRPRSTRHLFTVAGLGA